jgi:hypothetical protein
MSEGKGMHTFHEGFLPSRQKRAKVREDIDLKANSWNRVYKKADEVVTRNIFDEVILVPVRGKLGDMERIYSLDSVSQYIWAILDGKKRLKEILEGIIATFEVKREQAEQDVIEFIKMLADEGLILEVKE